MLFVVISYSQLHGDYVTPLLQHISKKIEQEDQNWNESHTKNSKGL